MFSIDGENIAWCSDFTLKRAKDEIEFEIAKREYKKIQEENKEKCQFDSGSVAEVC